jgi:carbonic anhydrase
MKFSIFKIVICTVLLSSAFTLHSAENGVMNFLNGLFMEGHVKADEYSNNNFKFKEPEATPTDTQTTPAAETTPAANPPATEQAQPTHTEPAKEINQLSASAVNVEDWLSITSPLFNDPIKFPELNLPDGTSTSIKTDKDHFRINNAYDAQKNDDDHPKSATEFYFRLTDNLIYYTVTKSDINTMGQMDFSSIVNAEETLDAIPCFKIDDKGSSGWKLCSHDKAIVTKWVCAIKKKLNIMDTLCNINPYANVIPSNVLQEKHINPIILIPIPSKECNEGWTYGKHGCDWNCTCEEGSEQSPIDLPKPKDAIPSPQAPIFNYQIAEPLTDVFDEEKQQSEKVQAKIVYKDNAIRILHPNMGTLTTLDGIVYEAREIVIHTPSEHTINGKRYPMEVQVIHTSVTKGELAKQAVLSFFMEKKAGVPNRFFEDINFQTLPYQSEDPRERGRIIDKRLFIPKLLTTALDSSIKPMNSFSFYTYQGSLTAPPCSERTIHYVASEPIHISLMQLQLFQEAIMNVDAVRNEESTLITPTDVENYRNIQPLNGRLVFFYDASKYCKGADVKHKKAPVENGHYEKVTRKENVYFKVDGDAPSGLPDTFLVSKAEAEGLDEALLK